MPGDDVEKFPAFEPVEWRPRGKKRSRRGIVLQLVFVALGIWAIYTLVLGDDISSPRADNLIQDEVPMPEATVDAVEPHPASEIFSKDEVILDAATETEEPLTADPDDAPAWPQTDLATALRQLFSVIPDEWQTQTLLHPIKTTGEERLKELGLRTRYFKRLFAAWETVHLVSNADGTGLYIRDDVIQYLKRHPQVAADLDMTTTEVIHSYEAYRSVITELATLLFPWIAPYYPDHMHLHSQFYRAGKGIVFTAGDKQAPFLLTSIPSIRHLGCNLPIEVMYLGDRDLSESVRSQLEALPGVTTRDISQMVNDRGWTLAGWAAKPFAILLCSFREAVFIDADSLFFQNPEGLFTDEAYLETGALFFKDRLILPQSKRKWLQDILPKPISQKVMESRPWTGESGHMQESGVIVVDKWRHFVALLLVGRMNGPDRDGDKARQIVGVYDMVYGDKETFWLGWELVGDLDYAFHDGDAGIMGVLEKPKDKPVSISTPTRPLSTETDSTDPDQDDDDTQETYTICAPQLLHLDRHGRPLWFNGWLLPNKYSPNEQEPARFEAYLQEPREVEEPAAWQLHESNVCCLTSEMKYEFTRGEREVLDVIVENGRRVGALGGRVLDI